MKFKWERPAISWKAFAMLVGGAAILAFGIYNIHDQSGVTEGGVLGLLLLLEHWFPISPAISSIVLNGICYLIGFSCLGQGFIWRSILATGGFALAYGILEQFPPLLPSLAARPLAAALSGGCFVGIGVGLSVRAGGASSGDDALALSVSKLTGCKVSRVYFVSDFTVLLLSLSYIPLKRIAFSLLTVMLSYFIIDQFCKK